VSQTQSLSDVPTLFRVTVEVGNLEEAATFYARLLNTPGTRHPGARQYFQCGSVIVVIIDPTQGGMAPTPGPKSLYFAVRDVDAVHQRAAELNALAPYTVHGEPAADVLVRPWGERCFYVADPWGNDLCFVEEGTLYS